MTDSYFLAKTTAGSKYSFKSYGCCESLLNHLGGFHSAYEMISLKDICSDRLREPEVVDKYVQLVSKFIGITLTRMDVKDSDVTGCPYAIDDFHKKYAVYQIGKYHSNKHLVAMHNMVRYLWYKEHAEIALSILALDALGIEMDIEDLFALAHSFQSSSNRALTGRPTYAEEGLLYFPKSETYIKGLSVNTMFNTVFDSRNILIIPSLKIRGSFFDDSEMVINSKISLNSLSSDESNFPENFSTEGFKEIITQYLKYKHIYYDAVKFISNKAGSIYRRFDIKSNNVDGITEINVSIGKTTTTQIANFNYTNEQELYANLFEK